MYKQLQDHINTERRKTFLGCICVCLSRSLYVRAHGSLMLFISGLSCVKMLKQAAKALSPQCKAACVEMTFLPKDQASVSVTEHGRHRAQSIKQRHYTPCTVGIGHMDLRSRYMPKETNIQIRQTHTGYHNYFSTSKLQINIPPLGWMIGLTTPTFILFLPNLLSIHPCIIGTFKRLMAMLLEGVTILD